MMKDEGSFQRGEMMSKVWFITGSSRGLGRAFVEAAITAGDQVAATARNIADLNALRETCGAAKWGVEGFSETLAREVGPLGVKVTIVEPGGFRTDFAGSSTDLREGRPEYDATVGATVRFQRTYIGRQPGDPAKAAATLLHLVSLPEPPLRILLGSDAYNAAEKNDVAKIELGRKCKDLGYSSDFLKNNEA
jgi:NAD(P)-dependent dehydrogenase (short-subunit alcohol dehydrogenase family)